MSNMSKGEKTRQMIINKAALLFTRNGFNMTSLNQILAATGLAKGGFYFHFKSKEELGLAVIASLENYWRCQLLPNLNNGKDAKEKLEIMLATPGDCLSTPDCIRPTILLLTLATEMIEVHDTFSRRIQDIVKEWWNTLAAIIDEGKQAGLFRKELDTKSVAGIILCNVMGANLLALLEGDSQIYSKQLSSLRALLFKGLSATA